MNRLGLKNNKQLYHHHRRHAFYQHLESKTLGTVDVAEHSGTVP